MSQGDRFASGDVPGRPLREQGLGIEGQGSATVNQPPTTDHQPATTGQRPVALSPGHAEPGQTKLGRQTQFGRRLITLSLLLIPLLYLVTLARSPVFGDPTEYTFVAHILGIAHPPGYAFITLLGKLVQTLIPLGEIPWRMHLLSAAAATLAAIFVYGTVRAVAGQIPQLAEKLPAAGLLSALFAALSVALAADFWQHAIHANPHIITATFLAANLFLLTRWWAACEKETDKQRLSPRQGDKGTDWLLAFAFTAGLGITHHPLTVFSFPAYGLFILWVRPGIWRDWRTLLKMAALALLGLSVWLYYPLRSAMEPAFGPATLTTLEGFLNHILARGISEGLPFYGLADLADRALVFWTLLRLQYSLPVIFLAVVGFLGLLRGKVAGGIGRAFLRPLALLYGLALLANLLFVINLRAQDIMAYLLGVFLVIGLLAGLGLLGLLALLQERLRPDRRAVALLVGALFLLGPVLQVVRNLPRISLAEYDAAAIYTKNVFDWFDGLGEEAILLNDWEHMTPLWYAQYVEERWPDAADITPVLVSTDRPWLESVFYYLPAYPVYLSGYRPEIAAAGFRLRPRGPFYQVVQPGDASIPPELSPIEPAAIGDLEIVALDLPRREAAAGEIVPLTLALRSPSGTEEYYVPVLYLETDEGSLAFEFTTDGHLVTPQWQPGEVIIERFDLALPHDLPGGRYPLSLGLRNLSSMVYKEATLPLGELLVTGQAHPIQTDRLLANFRQRVGLVSASARNGLFERRRAPWDEPIQAKAGDTIHLTLDWLSLAPAEESYTIFVHLIDLANQPLVALDYTPLGGATPTHLWIPKWLPSQEMKDPYRLTIPKDLPPGTYLIEAGLYEMTGGRRLHLSDPAGNMMGDRYILGAVNVRE